MVKKRSSINSLNLFAQLFCLSCLFASKTLPLSTVLVGPDTMRTCPWHPNILFLTTCCEQVFVWLKCCTNLMQIPSSVMRSLWDFKDRQVVSHIQRFDFLFRLRSQNENKKKMSYPELSEIYIFSLILVRTVDLTTQNSNVCSLNLMLWILYFEDRVTQWSPHLLEFLAGCVSVAWSSQHWSPLENGWLIRYG